MECTGDDFDQDGIPDSCDDCRFLFNPYQENGTLCTPPPFACKADLYEGILWAATENGTTASRPCPPPLRTLNLLFRTCTRTIHVHVHVHVHTVEHRYKEHLIPKHKIRYNHNFIIKELQWNTDITTGCKDRFVITINSL